jgi:lipoyl(octanoyl) transferase
MDEFWVIRAGLVPYGLASAAQKRLEAARVEGAIPDVLLLLEHPPVYTKGRRTTAAELPMGEDWYRMQGIEVLDTDRGGRVTYHGPGQLVGYPIVSLKPYGDDVHSYIRNMERVVIDSLAAHGVVAEVIDGLTGVWVPQPATNPAAPGREAEEAAGSNSCKVGSIGVHVNRSVTTHGFAVNVANDLQPFEWIVPCGIESCRMTSLSRELGAEQDVAPFATTVADRFADVYGRRAIEVGADELAGAVDGTEALAGAAAAALP